MATSRSATEEMPELQSAVEQLEARLEAVNSDLRRMRRASRWLRGLDRAMTVGIAWSAGLTLLAAAQPKPLRVKAPFYVVNSTKKRIFQVAAQPRGFALLNDEGICGACAEAIKDHVALRVRSPGGGWQAVMGVLDDKTPLLTLRYGERPRLTLGVVDDRAALNMDSADHHLVELTEGAFGGGALRLANAGGDSMVAAGVIANGVGSVQVYPTGNPGAGMLGLPGTFLCGIGCPK